MIGRGQLDRPDGWELDATDEDTLDEPWPTDFLEPSDEDGQGYPFLSDALETDGLADALADSRSIVVFMGPARFTGVHLGGCPKLASVLDQMDFDIPSMFMLLVGSAQSAARAFEQFGMAPPDPCELCDAPGLYPERTLALDV